MPEPLPAALDALRATLLDVEHLIRAVAAGRRRGEQPQVRRAELRPVDLKSGPHLQVVTSDGRQDTTTNHPVGDGVAAAAAAVDALLAQPFGNWYVESVEEVVQLRVTKKGAAQVHRTRTASRDVRPAERPAAKTHDRVKQRLIDPADPLFAALGADADKRRQVDAFLRLLAPVVNRAVPPAGLPEQGPATQGPLAQGRRPLQVVDLGCGNAYLTFAAHRYLTDRLGAGSVRTVGVDRSPQMIQRNAALAADVGLDGLSFEVGSIVDAEPFAAQPFADAEQQSQVDLVLALHACDTATDDALARAIRWGAAVTLAAPCCHHDVQRQLAGARAPVPYAALTRHPILRERFADVLTDGLRALLLRLLGHRVDVVEFVDSRHTPRNALLRVVRTGAAPTPEQLQEYDSLVEAWGVQPALADAVVPELTRARESVHAAAAVT